MAEYLTTVTDKKAKKTIDRMSGRSLAIETSRTDCLETPCCVRSVIKRG